MNDWLSIFALLLLLPAFLTMIFIPYWTRRTESFGVTIPIDIYYSKELKKLRKDYVIATILLSILLTASFVVLSWEQSESVITNLLSFAIITYFILSFLIYLFFHKKMKRLKETSNWKIDETNEIVVSTNFRREKLIYSNLWFSISFLMTGFVIFYTLKNYELLPEQIPLQYNFSGEVTNWAEKSYRSALALPATQLYLIVLFLFVNTIIRRAKQQIDGASPSNIRRNVLFRRRWSLFIIITGTATVGLLTFIQMTMFHPINNTVMMLVPMIFTFALLAYAIYLSFTTGQGGSRITKVEGADGKTINRDDDRYWKLGIFYFNREDPALFLEKRFGVGWTINYARPLAWIIFIVIIGLAILIPTILT